MHRTPIWRAASLSLVLAAVLGGCSTNTSSSAEEDSTAQTSDSVSELIEDGLANAQSEFQREVLEKAQKSGTISEADWKEANNQFLDCMIDKGHDMELVYEGSQVMVRGEAGANEAPGGDEAEQTARQEDFSDCSAKTSDYINEIYSYLNSDGSTQDPEEIERAVYDCLIESEVIPKDTTFDEFSRELSSGEGTQVTDENTPEGEYDACWEKVM